MSQFVRAALAGLLIVIAVLTGRPAFAGEPSSSVLGTPDGREVTVFTYPAAEPKGVMLFSHGGGAGLEFYTPLFDIWTAAGWTVLAPLHVDSRHHPDQSDYTLQTAFPARLADMASLSGAARERFADLPVVSVGHSYGSLIAAVAGGALAELGMTRDPAVRAVVMLSTPGRIPGLITSSSYASLEAPLLVLTGDADLVPGWVPDWQDHLAALEMAGAADHVALVREGGEHDFGLAPDAPETAVIEDTARIVLDFVTMATDDTGSPGAFIATGGEYTGYEIHHRAPAQSAGD
ncbi:alpha/beta hydrolase [Maricaulis sp. CAU 1757]